MTVDKDQVIKLLQEQVDSAKREIGALHILLAAIIGDGETARVPKNAIVGANKALKMSEDVKTDEFIIEVVPVPSKTPESVV